MKAEDIWTWSFIAVVKETNEDRNNSFKDKFQLVHSAQSGVIQSVYLRLQLKAAIQIYALIGLDYILRILKQSQWKEALWGSQPPFQ